MTRKVVARPPPPPRQAPPTPPATPVAVVEDNRLLCAGIVAALDRQPDLAVVAVAEDAPAALRRVPETRPQVVLVDAELGDHDSYALVAEILRAAPEVRVLVIDLLPAPEDVVEFIRQGASGFVVKDATVEDLVHAVRSVARGTDVLPPVLTGALLSHVAQLELGGPAAGTRRGIRVTAREREIIDLIADGLSNKEIAERVHLATHTVKSHVHNVLQKLALHSRLQLAAYVHQNAGRQAEA